MKFELATDKPERYAVLAANSYDSLVKAVRNHATILEEHPQIDCVIVSITYAVAQVLGALPEVQSIGKVGRLRMS